MKLVTAVVRPHVVDPVKEALRSAAVRGLTVCDTQGFGRQRGHTEHYRGGDYTTEFVPKVKLEIVVDDGDADRVVGVISEVANSGLIGDGKIWVVPVEAVVRVRTGEHGPDAL